MAAFPAPCLLFTIGVVLKHIPNTLTWLRLFSAPILIVVFQAAPPPWRDTAAAVFFVIITLTDWLDGYLARRYNLTSRFGQFLDPVADKIVVATALLLLLAAGRADLLATIIIVGREICVSALREWMAGMGQSRLVTPSGFGKCKTASQMTAIALLFYHQDIAGLPTALIGQGLLWIAALLTILSMALYLRAARFSKTQN